MGFNAVGGILTENLYIFKSMEQKTFKEFPNKVWDCMDKTTFWRKVQKAGKTKH